MKKTEFNKIIQIEESDFKILNEILVKYPYKFYVYGSRAKGNARRYSDLDLLCKEKITYNDLASLREDFEDSNLTIKIDILDASTCSEEFRLAIEKDLIEISITQSRKF